MNHFSSILTLLAQAAPAAGEDAPAGPPTQFLFIIIAIGVAFYFIILRPQSKERKEREKQLSAIGKGDSIVTIGGIHGVVTKLGKSGKTVEVEVAKNVRLVMNKSAVSSVIKKGRGGVEEPIEEME